MKIPGIDDLVEELREGRDDLLSRLDALIAKLAETNELLEQVVENTEENTP